MQLGNTTDKLGPKGDNRTSQIVTTFIAANTTFPIHQTGDKFYFVVATAALTVKPNNGSANEYVQGTGLAVDDLNIFKNIQITNRNDFSVVFQIFVGFGSYIDNRLIVFDPNVFASPLATAPVANTLNEILIPDMSGKPFTDANGNPMLALNRISLYISNVDLASSYNLQNVAENKTLLTVQPASNIVYPGSGDFRIKIPAAFINATVSELYNAIKPT